MELNRICWLGGPARSGKTTIADRLAKPGGLALHVDDIFLDKSACVKERHPNLGILHEQGPFGILRRSTLECITIWLGIYRESYEIVKQRLDMPERQGAVVVEGISLLPELLHADGITNACFLLSSDAFFQREVEKLAEFQAEMRELPGAEQMNANMIALMRAMRERIGNSARRLGYALLPVDAEHSLDENLRAVAERFLLTVSD